jgi:hypothetical protein
MGEETEERRKSGWTLWREIYGTIIGALAVGGHISRLTK